MSTQKLKIEILNYLCQNQNEEYVDIATLHKAIKGTYYKDVEVACERLVHEQLVCELTPAIACINKEHHIYRIKITKNGFEFLREIELSEANKESNKINKKILYTAVASVIVAIAVVFLSNYLDRLPGIEGKLTPVGGRIDNQPVVVDNEYGYLSYNNLNKREVFDAFLKEKLYNTGCIESGKFDQCSINLLTANKGNSEIFITGLACKISNIKQINETLLLAVGRQHLLKPTKGYEIVGFIENHGWADAEDVVITVSDRDSQLEHILYNYPYSINIGTIEYGESIVQPLLSNDMFKQQSIPENGLHISPTGLLLYTDINKQPMECEINIVDFNLAPDGIVPINDGSGGGEFKEFGILVDAHHQNMEFRKDAHVLVTSNEIIELPIRLFTNRSCSFDVEVEITVNYSDTSVWAKFEGIELFVSSIRGSSLIDGELLEEYALEYGDIVYFPYSHADWK